MTRPTFEVADILRAQGDRFLDRYRSSFDFQQLKAFRAILRCRTAALGGHRDACPSCGHQAISYNSCRNRHCPKCQTQARERWLAARERELLTTSYFHVVFTVPHELNVLALENPRLFYDLLFTASAANLAGDRHRSQTPGRRDRRDQHPAHLGTEPASASPHSLRHSRGRTLTRSPSMGPPTLSFLLTREGPQPRLSRQVPRRPETSPPPQQLCCAGPAAALADPQQFAKLIRRLHRHDWVVYAKPAFGGPMQVLRYLGRYTHRVAISNHRLLAFDQERVTFRWKDYAHGGKQGTMTLARHRVLTALLSARAPQRIRAHPSLWVPRQSLSRFPLGTIPTTAVQQLLHARPKLEPAKLRRRVLLSGIAHAAARP